MDGMRRRAWAIGFGLGVVCTALVVGSLTCQNPFLTEDKADTAGSSRVQASSTVNAASVVGLPLYVDPDSRALETVAAWRITRAGYAKLIDSLAHTPQGAWCNGWQ